MSMKKLFEGILILLIMTSANSSFALSSSNNQQLINNAATPVELGAHVNNLVFTGVVKRIPDGTALVTNTATYLLSGGNFESIVGKEVNIIGKVVKEGSIEKIEVARAQLAHE